MDRREQNKQHAVAHEKEMDERYGEKIKSSVKGSVIYGGTGKTPRSVSGQGAEIIVLNTDSTEAVLQNAGAALLNFASYRKAGGGFITGAWAQEEAICHDSTLYNVLREFGGFYAENEKTLNRSLYTDRAIFSPGIIFERDDRAAECAVITCAAPNFSAARGRGVTQGENEAALAKRVDFVISIAEEQGCETAVLGAWGCGVFGQDPKVVARLFKERLAAGAIKRAVFAIPGQNNNYTSFKDILG